ncbi:venom allergen 3-like [Sitophilus oryzae]|uniref:Venom allergen 3-like n=1 Tax=Sitophilus oryzae TaxID=7048 RepID=A0A6J2XGS8_SITOR|nr:venom allergen 3-like [Sitophilus oryzae]
MANLQVVILLIAVCFKLGAGEGTLLGFGVSAAEQKQIVDLHNSVRNQIMEGTLSGQPKGVNLLQLKYDSSLAEAAQEIANTTIFKHAAVSDDRFYVGQNLFAAASTAPGSGIANWTSAIISSWVSEHKSYTYAKCCVSGTGHYTQVIWAKTQYVGCGFSYFKTTGKYAYNYLYVCNYGPGGNSVGSYPYETES